MKYALKSEVGYAHVSEIKLEEAATRKERLDYEEKG